MTRTLKIRNAALILGLALIAGIASPNPAAAQCALFCPAGDGWITWPVGWATMVDLDGNGGVTLPDFALFAQAYDTMAGEGYYDPRADYNCDSRVDLTDFALFAAHFLH